MTKWFIADTHFGHEKIIEYCNRGPSLGWSGKYDDTDEMDADIIDCINNHVKPGDQLYMLGDISFHPLDKTVEILKSIKCQKLLIVGNHDRHVKKEEFREQFVWLKSMKSVKLRKGTPNVVLCHYPLLTWNGEMHGKWHFHGHSHGQLHPSTFHPARFDVGWDVWNAPVDFEKVNTLYRQRIGAGVPAHSTDYHNQHDKESIDE
jgi:calcineurin-like phosphoesterase family protein